VSEAKRLEENLSYLNRFIIDLQTIKLKVEASHINRTYKDCCEDIFNQVKGYSIEEIVRLKDENAEKAQAIQDFSNQVLKLISILMSSDVERHKNQNVKLSLIDDIISTTSSSRNELSSQIKEIRVSDAIEVPDIALSDPPPIRRSNTGKEIRKVGSHPKQTRKIGERPNE
jgi:hypothetical protein